MTTGRINQVTTIAWPHRDPASIIIARGPEEKDKSPPPPPRRWEGGTEFLKIHLSSRETEKQRECSHLKKRRNIRRHQGCLNWNPAITLRRGVFSPFRLSTGPFGAPQHWWFRWGLPVASSHVFETVTDAGVPPRCLDRIRLTKWPAIRRLQQCHKIARNRKFKGCEGFKGAKSGFLIENWSSEIWQGVSL